MQRIIFLIFFILNMSVFANINVANVVPPNFLLRDQFQVEHSLDKYKDKKIFLIFWSTTCNYCIEEIEILKKLYVDYNKNQGNIIFLTFNKEDEDILKNFLQEKNLNFPVINDKLIFQEYFVERYPTIYKIDKNGKVQKVFYGRLKLDKFKKLIDED